MKKNEKIIGSPCLLTTKNFYKLKMSEFKPNLGKWYLIAFDGELLFHNNCRAICVILESEEPFTIKQVYRALKMEDPDDLLYKDVKKLKTLEEVNRILDDTWKQHYCTAYAILQPGDMGKLIEIMETCGDCGWEFLRESPVERDARHIYQNDV